MQVGSLLGSVWSKVCISAAVNPTNLLTAGYCDDLIHDELMIPLVTSIFGEVIAVGNAAGAQLDFTADDKLALCQQRFPHCKFSMLQVRPMQMA